MSKYKEVAISVKDLHKSFKLPHEQHSGMKQAIINIFRKDKKRGYEIQHVLKGLDFEIEKGDFFGIVGRNGSGKSTLLKTLAGIYSPDKGEVQVNGTLVPFIELGVGFNPELTGRENVFLNGALLGFSRDEMEAMYNDIVEFAELEKFMDQKLKNYSSGMQVRLAFSIAIRADGDILLLDEVLAVGDEAFQRKCYSYFAELKKNKKTVILVTHSMDSVQQFCNKAMLIDKGHKTVVGSPMKISQIYKELNDQDSVTVNIGQKDDTKSTTKYLDAKVNYIHKARKLRFEIDLKSKIKIDNPLVAMGIYKDTGEQIYRWTSDEKVPRKLNLNERNMITIELDDTLPVGYFTVNLYVKKHDRSMDYATFNDIVKFEIKNKTPYKYAVYWKIPENTSINGVEVSDVD